MSTSEIVRATYHHIQKPELSTLSGHFTCEQDMRGFNLSCELYPFQTGLVNNVVFTSCLEPQVRKGLTRHATCFLRLKGYINANLVSVLDIFLSSELNFSYLQNEQLSLVQKLVRTCNPDVAFILAKGGEVTR